MGNTDSLSLLFLTLTIDLAFEVHAHEEPLKVCELTLTTSWSQSVSHWMISV